MKPSTVLIAFAILASTTLAGPTALPPPVIRELPVRPNECGFYAAINFETPNRPRHCWMETVLVPKPGGGNTASTTASCDAIAEGFKNKGLGSCNLFTSQECVASKGTGAQGALCTAFNQFIRNPTDAMILGGLRNCLKEAVENKARGVTDVNTWTRSQCEPRRSPSYTAFRSK